MAVALAFTQSRRYLEGPMDPSAALLAGLAAGLAIAMQVGAVSLLLVEAAVVAGPRVGVAAGMGVAAADLGFAAIAAAAGGAAGAALSSHETEIRVVAAIVIAAIAVHGLIALALERHGAGREREADAGRRTGSGRARVGAAPERTPPPPLATPLLTPSSPASRHHRRQPPDDRLLCGRRRRPLPRRACCGGCLCRRRGHRLRGLASHSQPRRRPCRSLDDPAGAYGVCRGGRLAVLAIAAHLALG